VPESKDIQLGGPYRAVPVVQRAPPEDLIVRREPEDLVIEWRPGPAATISAVVCGVMFLSLLPHYWVGSGWLIVANMFAVMTLASIDHVATGGGVTLQIAGDRVTYRRRNLNRRVVDCALADLRIEGVVRDGDSENDVYYLRAIVDSLEVKLFRGFSPRYLEWIREEIRSWRAERARRPQPA
jgi:hypothetical protein